jgi:hypothetical protein
MYNRRRLVLHGNSHRDVLRLWRVGLRVVLGRVLLLVLGRVRLLHLRRVRLLHLRPTAKHGQAGWVHVRRNSARPTNKITPTTGLAPLLSQAISLRATHVHPSTQRGKRYDREDGGVDRGRHGTWRWWRFSVPGWGGAFLYLAVGARPALRLVMCDDRSEKIVSLPAQKAHGFHSIFHSCPRAPRGRPPARAMADDPYAALPRDLTRRILREALVTVTGDAHDAASGGDNGEHKRRRTLEHGRVPPLPPAFSFRIPADGPQDPTPRVVRDGLVDVAAGARVACASKSLREVIRDEVFEGKLAALEKHFDAGEVCTRKHGRPPVPQERRC